MFDMPNTSAIEIGTQAAAGTKVIGGIAEVREF
jgi:hypothetical protein